MTNNHLKSLKSMTAFGRAVAVTPVGRFCAEVQTVNRRHLEVHFTLPRLFSRFEVEMRKWVESTIARGQVSISISWRPCEGEAVQVIPNLPLAKALKEAWEKIAHEVGAPAQISLSLLAQQKDLMIFEEEIKEESSYLETLKKVVFEALQNVVFMREKEGEALANDLDARLIHIEAIVETIAAGSSQATDRYRQKLIQRLEELFSGMGENEEKVLREVALFAEKIDITEEIVRLKSHVKQFRQLLKAPLEIPLETRGKTLEFLVQELHREVNTIGSKSSDLSISQQVVFLKSELERIREQVQNIE